MKPHPELKASDILKALLDPELLPDRVGGGASLDARVSEKEEVLELAKDLTKFRTLCIACDDDVPLLEALPCVCGGFVCPACVEREGTDACDHVPPPDPEL